MPDKKKRFDQPMRKDSLDEGRKKYELDVDRMMNEGMAGGNVFVQGGLANIEEAHDQTDQGPEKRIND